MTSAAPVTESALVNSCRKLSVAMGCYLEFISQRGGRGSGTTVGAPDAFLYCSNVCIPIEFKVGRNQLSEEQAACYAKRLDQHVETAVIRTEEQFVELVNRCRRGMRG